MMQLIGYSEEVLATIDEPEAPTNDDCPLCYGECICFADPS